jgi:hypothetical protein
MKRFSYRRLLAGTALLLFTAMVVYSCIQVRSRPDTVGSASDLK